jgi:adenosylhomocysteine nucleosidase
MNTSNPVAIVVPMEDEFRAYWELLSGMRRLDGCGPWEVYEARAGDRPVVLIISDCGPTNAGAATERVIAQHQPVAVLHGGSAGAHNPDLMPGDVVIGDRCAVLTERAEQEARRSRGLHPKLMRFRRDGARHHFEDFPADPDLLARAERIAAELVTQFDTWDAPGWPEHLPRRPSHAITGLIGSEDKWTTEPEKLRALREDFGAECEDMESAYVAQICALHHIPFLAVRAISDNEAARAFTPAEVPPALAAAGVRAAYILAALAAEL